MPSSGQQRYCSYECRQASRYGKLFGFGTKAYIAMFDAQDGVCAICKGSRRGWMRGRRPLVVDHDHATGKVRGLLCSPCNASLGRFGDDPARLREAADYLERTS